MNKLRIIAALGLAAIFTGGCFTIGFGANRWLIKEYPINYNPCQVVDPVVPQAVLMALTIIGIVGGYLIITWGIDNARAVLRRR